MTTLHTYRLIWAAKLLLACIFLAAGIPKLLNPTGFETAVKSFEIGPTWIVPIIAQTLPSLEILLAILLFTNQFNRPALLTTTLLYSIFCLAFLWVITTGKTPDCGCFGQNSSLNAKPPEGALRSALLTALSGALYIGACAKKEK